jgi:rhodanese-related sulfurtransferase
VAAIVLAVRWGGRRWKGLGKTTSNKQAILLSIGQCAAICLAAATSAFAYHFINDEGLLLRGTSTANIQQAYRATFIPKLTTAKTNQLLIEKAALFVDPRPDYIFKTSHLRDAINLPGYFTKDERANVMAGIEKGKQIVVYCDNSTRHLGDATATWLKDDGFTNIAIYRDKWEQWAK